MYFFSKSVPLGESYQIFFFNVYNASEFLADLIFFSAATTAAAGTAILNYHTDREMERVKAYLRKYFLICKLSSLAGGL